MFQHLIPPNCLSANRVKLPIAAMLEAFQPLSQSFSHARSRVSALYKGRAKQLMPTPNPALKVSQANWSLHSGKNRRPDISENCRFLLISALWYNLTCTYYNQAKHLQECVDYILSKCIFAKIPTHPINAEQLDLREVLAISNASSCIGTFLHGERIQWFVFHPKPQGPVINRPTKNSTTPRLGPAQLGQSLLKSLLK